MNYIKVSVSIEDFDVLAEDVIQEWITENYETYHNKDYLQLDEYFEEHHEDFDMWLEDYYDRHEHNELDQADCDEDVEKWAYARFEEYLEENPQLLVKHICGYCKKNNCGGRSHWDTDEKDDNGEPKVKFGWLCEKCCENNDINWWQITNL